MSQSLWKKYLLENSNFNVINIGSEQYLCTYTTTTTNNTYSAILPIDSNISKKLRGVDLTRRQMNELRSTIIKNKQ
jgi:hypothetical protein